MTMAAGDRYSNGKPKDIVRHIWGNGTITENGIVKWDGKTVCGRKDVGWASHNDWSEVTCLKCLKKKNEFKKSPTPHHYSGTI